MAAPCDGLVGRQRSDVSQTLIKPAAGYHAPEPGAELAIDGNAVRLPLAPGRFRDLGMAFVHQDPGLIASLSVVENLRIGNLARRRMAVDWDGAVEVRRLQCFTGEFSNLVDRAGRAGGRDTAAVAAPRTGDHHAWWMKLRLPYRSPPAPRPAAVGRADV